jgi:large subunit ribosomal protein L13
VDSGKTTKFVKENEVDKKWYVVNAEGQVLGRLATQIARILRGKHKPIFTPNTDTGDYVIVINADKVRLTGKRPEQKTYFRYSGYPGGDTVTSFKEMIVKRPDYVIQHAVGGMLPHNRLGRRLRKKLKVYRGSEHPHKAQQPINLDI